MYFYRDSNKKEIDVILFQDGTVTPIEIKKSSAPQNAVKNFTVLKPIERETDEEDTFSERFFFHLRLLLLRRI